MMELDARSIGPRRVTLAGEVRAEIERMIVDGDLRAGEKLNELTLSTAMGVSRGTVREAIRSLADSGLIDLIANRGAFVREMTLDEVRNLYELRGAIFALCCAAAAHRVAEGKAPELPQLLGENLALMRRAHADDDAAGYFALNLAFHALLTQGAGNPRAATIYENLVKEMRLFRRRGLSIASNVAQSIEEHDAIADAVAQGAPEAASAAAQQHINSGLARYMRIVNAGPGDTA